MISECILIFEPFALCGARLFCTRAFRGAGEGCSARCPPPSAAWACRADSGAQSVFY